MEFADSTMGKELIDCILGGFSPQKLVQILFLLVLVAKIIYKAAPSLIPTLLSRKGRPCLIPTLLSRKGSSKKAVKSSCIQPSSLQFHSCI